MKERKSPDCARCPQPTCYFGILDGVPDNCPSRQYEELIPKSLEVMREAGDQEVARISSVVEGTGYGNLTRIEEIIDFARRMGFKRLGIAFCVGFRKEARTFERILRAHGLEVVSVCCKLGGVEKGELGVADEEKIRPGTHEGFCNPIAQALVLEEEGTELNVLLGLCVGHDALFLKHTGTLTTVLAAKDRVTGHNPLAALYTSGSYYARLLHPESPDSVREA